jgi:hypothetical protein
LFEFSDIFRYIEKAFQIKGAYAPGRQNAMSEETPKVYCPIKLLRYTTYLLKKNIARYL